MAPTRIPRRIVTFWHDPGDMPAFARRCLDNLRALHPGPGWTVDVLDDRDLPSRHERPDLWRLGIQHRADWMRIHALAAGGGIWFDATCVLYRPVDDWMDLNTPADIVGYAYPHCADARILENWALFAPTGSPFVAAWRDEFDRAVRRGLSEYVDDVRRAGLAPPPGLALPYHAMHVAGWVVMRAHPEWRCDIRDAAPRGPLGTLAACGWPFDAHREGCIRHILHGPRGALRAECSDTFTKLCCGLWGEFDRAWREGRYNATGDIARQLQLAHRQLRPAAAAAAPGWSRWWSLVVTVGVLLVGLAVAHRHRMEG